MTIDFDELTNGTALADLYQSSLGVGFQNDQTAQALVYADNAGDVGKAYSPPNVATNSPVSPNTSAGVPMRINLPAGLSHVGFRLGNGKDAGGGGPDLTALIIAYDAAGSAICRFSVAQVPASHTLFAGIYDARGRIAAVDVDYGSSLLSESIDDLVFGPAQFATQIRLCRTDIPACDPVANAAVHLLRNGAPTGQILGSDSQGYLLDRDQVEFGDRLWATSVLSSTGAYTTLLTMPNPAPVTLTAFHSGTGMAVELDTPLILHDLTIAAQWDMTADPAYRAELANRIVDASNRFYDFSDGRMALGNVTVYQNYDQWNTADVRLYASNTMRPQAEIGGVVTTLTPDPLVPNLDYYPGFLYMGSNWDRTGAPVATTGIDPDWSVALAHELGHYLLFLYDTYLSLNENNQAVEIDTCTGSAMGWAYEDANTEFIFDTGHWNSAACVSTIANQTLGRTEWATIQLWYADLIAPTAVNPGPPAPPAALTQVQFQPPSSPTTPLPNQTFTLGYQDGETASKAARGWLISDQRVLDQGKPISGTTSITLNNAQVGERFCLFDVSTSESRRQFGCELIAANDNVLTLRKDVNWAPVIQISPITTQTIAISVTQSVEPGLTLAATIYPEDENTATSISLVSNGDRHTGVFNSPIPATSAYISVNVVEGYTEENPRREVMIGYGVGGSGAFGPASRLSGVPVVSEDGLAEFAFDKTTTLSQDQFLLWQSMAGSPGDTPDVAVLGESYRLLARPLSLAEGGTVAVRVPDTAPPTGLSAAAAFAPTLHFWTGSEWVPLASTEIVDPQGGAKIIAPSRGVGVYALLVPELSNSIYLPAIQR